MFIPYHIVRTIILILQKVICMKSLSEQNNESKQKAILKAHPLLEFDWRAISEGEEVHILDFFSYMRINEALTNHSTDPIENINRSIILADTSSQITYSQSILIENLSEDASALNLKIKMISFQANEQIFTRLGYSGEPIKRRVIIDGGSKKVDLYPKQIKFQLISARLLDLKYPMKQEEDVNVGYATSCLYQINYYSGDRVETIRSKIQQILRKSSPSITSEFRIYKYDPNLFKISSLERLIQYYYFKEDMKFIASPEQKVFYSIIDDKKYDQFLTETFPGKLVRNEKLGEIVSKEDKLIVQYFHEEKWVFPQQSSFSEAKMCRFCYLVAQLYMKFVCQKCGAVFLYCSRVCHFQGLMEHPCKWAKDELITIYGRQFADVFRDSSSNINNFHEIVGEDSQSQLTANRSITVQSLKGSNDQKSSQKLVKNVLPIKVKQDQKKGSKNGLEKNKTIDIDINLPPTLSSNTVVPLQRPRVESQQRSVLIFQKGRGGIENIGNICYMNSSIQVIFRTELSKIVSEMKSFDKKQPLLNAFSNLLKQLNEATPNIAVSKTKIEMFKNVIGRQLKQFQGYGQHDAHQFLTLFLDKLNQQLKSKAVLNFQGSFQQNSDLKLQVHGRREWLQFYMNEISPITSLFYGQLLQKTECPHCHSQSNRFAPFNCLSCSIPANYQSTQFDVFYESFHCRQKIKQINVSCSGTVMNMLDYVKDLVKIPEEKIMCLKLFACSRESALIEYDLKQQLSDVVYQTLTNGINEERKLYVFQSPFVSPLTLEFGFQDESKRVLTFKRPLFFDPKKIITCKNIYQAVRDYLYSFFVAYRGQNVDVIYNKMTRQIESFFTIVMEQTDKNRNIKFKEVPLKFCDQIVHGLGQKSCVFWVTLKSYKNKSSDLVENLFYKVLVDNFNKFQKVNSKSSDRQSQSGFHKGLLLIDCLKEQFNKKSVLDKENEWNCPSCEQKRRAHNSTSLYKTSRYLLIQIKRFKKNYDGTIYQKNKTKVEPPLKLDLSEILQNKTLPEAYFDSLSRQEKQKLKISGQIDKSVSCFYRLKGLILHEGDIKMGHYKALCACAQGEWWQFQDRTSKPVKIEEQIKISRNQEKVYIMLYERIIK